MAMTSTHIELDKKASHLQREVCLIVLCTISAEDCNGEICKISGSASTPKELFSSLVDQWRTLFVETMAMVRSKNFGHLNEDELASINAVMGIGVIILQHFRSLHQNAESLIDLTGAVQTLKILTDSYDLNPINDELNRLALAYA